MKEVDLSIETFHSKLASSRKRVKCSQDATKITDRVQERNQSRNKCKALQH